MRRGSGTAQAPFVMGRMSETWSISWRAPRPFEPERGAAADQEERAPRRVGVRHARHRIGDAGAGHHDRDPEPPGEARPGVGGVRRGLLVADVDHPDAVTEAGVVDRQDVAAAEREDRAHALAGEDARDQLSAGQIRHGAAKDGLDSAQSGTRARTSVPKRSSCSSKRPGGTAK